MEYCLTQIRDLLLSSPTGMRTSRRPLSHPALPRSDPRMTRPNWGSRRYQQKIFGKGDSDDITAGRQERLHSEKQYVLLCVASYAERDITVLDSKTGRVTSD